MKKAPRKTTNIEIWEKIKRIGEDVKYPVYVFRAIAELFRTDKWIRTRIHAHDLLMSKYEWRFRQMELRIDELEQGTAKNEVVEEVELESQWIVDPDGWSDAMHEAFYEGADPDPLKQLITPDYKD